MTRPTVQNFIVSISKYAIIYVNAIQKGSTVGCSISRIDKSIKEYLISNYKIVMWKDTNIAQPTIKDLYESSTTEALDIWDAFIKLNLDLTKCVMFYCMQQGFPNVKQNIDFIIKKNQTTDKISFIKWEVEGMNQPSISDILEVNLADAVNYKVLSAKHNEYMRAAPKPVHLVVNYLVKRVLKLELGRDPTNDEINTLLDAALAQ